jgi:hypothetical protein
MRDSYLRFFEEGYISKEQFFEFGLKEIIYSPYDKAEVEWTELKRKILNNDEVYIRGFGRDASGTYLFQDLYKQLVGNSNVIKDPTNNAEPTKVIKELTGYSKTKSSNYELIRNYQISHVFGRTKNVYAFTAPWNLVYIPKILDPFTGHEAKGELIHEFTFLFRQQTYKKFEILIDDFNEIVSNASFIDNLDNCLSSMEMSNSYSKQDIVKLRTSVKVEFMPIGINAYR